MAERLNYLEGLIDEDVEEEGAVTGLQVDVALKH